MGALHQGHRSLIRAARLSCDAVVVSLFVNPQQFGPREDLAQYPRRPRRDAELCRTEGVDVLFAPSPSAVYPPGFATTVCVRGLSQRWEGEWRPTHLEGVATIVTKLLSLARPASAFFGHKDYQQAMLVKRLVEDLNLGTQLVVCPTVREADGLAVSSRNQYLSQHQRSAAPILFASLKAGREAIREGRRKAGEIKRAMLRTLRSEPLARIDYLAVCDPDTLEPVVHAGRRVILLGALRIGRVRLIDNLMVRVPGMRRR